jgi:hypothetical protein
MHMKNPADLNAVGLLDVGQSRNRRPYSSSQPDAVVCAETQAFRFL